eukprot:3681060-Amphidinium_carterae.1
MHGQENRALRGQLQSIATNSVTRQKQAGEAEAQMEVPVLMREHVAGIDMVRVSDMVDDCCTFLLTGVLGAVSVFAHLKQIPARQRQEQLR